MHGGNKKHYDFRKSKSLKELFKSICYREILIPAIEREQNFDYKITELKKYRPRTTDNIESKDKLLINAQIFYDGEK